MVIADDEPLYRVGLARAIERRADLRLVGAAGDGAGALELIAERSPAVAVVDARLEAAAPAIVRRLRSTRVIFVATEPDSGSVYSALEAGAAGYLSKRDDEYAIHAAISRAADGEIVLSPEAQTALAHRIQAEPRPDGGLSGREHEVLELAADGLSTTEMAARLYLSRATIKTHLAHLYVKLGVSDKTAAVATGLRRRLID